MAFTVTNTDLSGDGSVRIVTWSAGATGDSGSAVESAAWADRCVHVTGTFGGATVAIQGSNDGSDWQTLNNAQGTAATFTAAGLKQIVEVPRFMRPTVTGGAASAIKVVLVARRMQQIRT